MEGLTHNCVKVLLLKRRYLHKEEKENKSGMACNNDMVNLT